MTQYGFIFVEKYITAPSMSCFVSVLLSVWFAHSAECLAGVLQA